MDNRASRRRAWATVGVPLIATLWALHDAAVAGIDPRVIAIAIVMYVLVALGTEIGLHRLLSHRAFRASKPVLVALAVLGSMAAQGPPLFWAATHRRHHAQADRAGDPHSPHASQLAHERAWRRLFHAHVGWLFEPVEDARHEIHDLIRNRLLLRVDQLYPAWLLLGVVLPCLAGLLFTGSVDVALRAAVWGGPVRIALWQQVTWSVNSFGHLLGSRPYQTKDRSTNNVGLALLTLGGGWHNNHHAFPSSAKVGLGTFQFDIHYRCIQLLAALGLVTDLKVPRRSATTRRRKERCHEPVNT